MPRGTQHEGTKSRVLLEHLPNSGDLKCFRFFVHICFLLRLPGTFLWSLPVLRFVVKKSIHHKGDYLKALFPT